MIQLNSEVFDPQRNINIDDNLDPRIIAMWSKADLDINLFYQTGFETILFKKDPLFALETVLASVFSWDDELLIAGSDMAFNIVEPLLGSQGIVARNYNWLLNGWGNLPNVIRDNNLIKNLLIVIDDYTDVDDLPIDEIILVTKKNKIGLIIFCEEDVDGLNDKFKGAIDFMVGKCNNKPHQSFLVARRSRLVQTEGYSRNFNLDLYRYWQFSLRNRNSIIEPMVM